LLHGVSISETAIHAAFCDENTKNLLRKRHDGLAALVQGHLRQKPFDGSVYVFRAMRADRLKMIF